MEYRLKDVSLTCEEGELRVGGYINVTERESEILFSKRRGKWFKEVMKRGVFDSAIKRASQIPLLLEHSWDSKLASTEDSTLSLREDNIGLRFDAVINDESVYEKVKNGLINSCSFGFRALSEEIEPINNKLERRFVNAIELMEVSLVANPAYVGSLVESRAYEKALEEDEEVEKEDINDTEDSKEADENESMEDNKESVDEEIEDSKEEEVEEAQEDSEEESEAKEEDEDRALLEEEALPMVEETSSNMEEVAEIIDEVIANNEQELAYAEQAEQDINSHIQMVEQDSKEYIEDLKETSRTVSTDIIKLRLKLLKLKSIKESL